MKELIKKHQTGIKLALKVVCSVLIVIAGNYFLQLSQNDLSWELATKFAFSWHTEKFFLGCLVLLVFLGFLIALIGSWLVGNIMFIVTLGILGFANYQKMSYRLEPIYPDDLKMITELSLLKEMAGTGPFILCLVVIGVSLGAVFYAIYRSFFKSKKQQIIRLSSLALSLFLLLYISNFNQPNNLLRKGYNKTALWIPYSQKMNYYNTGFMGGFLYNLKVEPMAKPANYSKEKVAEIVASYPSREVKGPVDSEQPNIVYIMSESFSDPLRLTGLQTSANPLKEYKKIANDTYSGQMLSQNYGGGTANIEFEALTGFSMEPFNGQLTTPYTMLVPTLTEVPSLVSLLKEDNYQATAIHPYNTSMYKRKDVYDVLGFDKFIDETTLNYQEKIENNPYISDESALQEVSDILEKGTEPQFVHLVTMQTHMPYSDKYQPSGHRVDGVANSQSIDSYMTDIEYASEALANFIERLANTPRRTLVVFWGDHLPSIYSDDYQAQNSQVDLHLTEFLFYDSAQKLTYDQETDTVISPFYFGPKLFELANLPQTGFYQLLNQLETTLPAFEKNFYLKDGQWHEKNPLAGDEKQIYDDYSLIQYDIVAGKQYSLDLDFFK